CVSFPSLSLLFLSSSFYPMPPPALYTLSLHDALPIYWDADARGTIIGISRGTTAGHIARATLEAIAMQSRDVLKAMEADSGIALDRKSTRLNSSHVSISYAVFCLEKKKHRQEQQSAST